LPFPDLHLPPEVQADYDAMYQRMGEFNIPSWEEIHKSAINSHQCFPDIYGIAWDYVITPEGPFLLEGNTGWGHESRRYLVAACLQDEYMKE